MRSGCAGRWFIRTLKRGSVPSPVVMRLTSSCAPPGLAMTPRPSWAVFTKRPATFGWAPMIGRPSSVSGDVYGLKNNRVARDADCLVEVRERLDAAADHLDVLDRVPLQAKAGGCSLRGEADEPVV